MTSTGVSVADRAVREFERRFDAPPHWVARAPGRVNLIGDHTDYNDGFVLPMAIDRATWIAFRPRDDGWVIAHSLDFSDETRFALASVIPHRQLDSVDATHAGAWGEYIRGVAWALGGAGHSLNGWEGVVASDVPAGAGLSSSAALELAAMRAFAAVSELDWTPVEMAKLARRAENEWVGVSCGIMDPLIAATGVAGNAMLIDCRSLAARPVLIPTDARVVVLDSATRRELVTSAYNERRAQCAEAAAFFGAPALRDVDVESFARGSDNLPPLIRRRAQHVITENARTVAAAAALARGDTREVGHLMNESHASLRDEFEVSRRELDIIVELAQAHRACHGARMTGAGFGGCAVALVHRAGVPEFVADVAEQYESATGLHPAVYVCAASEGASVLRSD